MVKFWFAANWKVFRYLYTLGSSAGGLKLAHALYNQIYFDTAAERSCALAEYIHVTYIAKTARPQIPALGWVLRWRARAEIPGDNLYAYADRQIRSNSLAYHYYFAHTTSACIIPAPN